MWWIVLGLVVIIIILFGYSLAKISALADEDTAKAIKKMVEDESERL